MSSPHPLNQAVIAQALHDLRNGQLRRCKAMGFGEEELDALKHPALVSVLINTTVPWCSVSVNREVLKRLLSQVQDVEQEIATVDRVLRLGASTEMVSRFYGLTHQEVALRRDILGLPKRKGRHPVLDEAQETGLWKHWKAGVAERHIALDDERAMLGLTMDLAETLTLQVVSNRDWIVTLDVSADEYYGAEQVKRALVRYPLKVVRLDVDPQRNPFGLALDCYASAPQRIEAPPPAQPPASAPGGGAGFSQGDTP